MKDTNTTSLTAIPTVPGIGTYVWRADRDTVEWNDSLCAVYGVETPPATEAAFLDLVHPDDRLRVEAETISFLESGDSYEHQFRIVRPDGEVRFILDKAAIERDAEGRMRVVYGVNIDMTNHDNRIVEAQALREDEERLRLAGAAAGIGFWDVYLGTGRLDWSDEMYDLLGLPRGGASSVDLFFEHVLEEDRDRTRSAFERAVADRTLFSEEFRIRRADGAVRYLVGRGRVMREEGEVPTRAIGVNYDVTDRKQAQAHVHDLMREMSHRAKNAYTLVLAIAKQVQRRSPDDFFPRFSDRIAALAASHNLVLETAGPEGASLRGLVATQLRPIDESGDRIEIAGPDVTLRPEAAQALGMVLHELGTNATKHGALSVPGGRVALAWDLSSGRFRVDWREEGGPSPSPPKHKGFGTLVLGTLTERTLNVTCESDWRHEGLCWTLQGGADQLLSD